MQRKDRLAPPIKRQVHQIVWLLFIVCLIVFSLGYFQAQAMNAVLGYVRGEGIWGKAQKDASLILYEYIQSPSEARFQQFITTLNVNLADKTARLALQQSPPDTATAAQALIEGGNHPQDVNGMVRLFILFQDVHHMREAIRIWGEADAQLQNLIELAHAIRDAHLANPNADLTPFKPHLTSLNTLLNQLESDFSNEISQGARWMKRTFLVVNFCLLAAIFLIVGTISRRILREINDTESELRYSELRFRTLCDANIIGIMEWGSNGELYDGNDEFLDTLGYSRQELQSGALNWRSITPEESRELDDDAMAQIEEKGYCLPFNKLLYHKKGHKVPVRVGGALMDGSTERGIAFMVDRSQEQEMEDQLKLSATVLDASRDGILICDHERTVLTANEAFCRMSGFPAHTVIGSPGCFYNGESRDETAKVEAALTQRGYWQGDTEIVLSDGESLPVRASISSIKDQSGDITHYVAVFADISARKALERDLTSMAHYDHLTGLANRSLFSDRLATAIKRAHRSHNHCALLFVDLDKFKPVNDQYGHGLGDLLLKQVAERLQEVSRKSDTVGRIGGDEFVMIVESLAHTKAVHPIAEKIIDQLSRPFHVEGHAIQIGCSVGIALYPQHGDDGISLTRAADIAMYAAKGSPETNYYIYSANQRLQ